MLALRYSALKNALNKTLTGVFARTKRAQELGTIFIAVLDSVTKKAKLNNTVKRRHQMLE